MILQTVDSKMKDYVNNPYQGLIVCIDGNFSLYFDSKKQVKSILQKRGVQIDENLSPQVDIFIAGARVSNNVFEYLNELHNAVYDVDLAMQCFVFLMRDHSHLFDNIKIKYGQSFKSVSTRKSNVERSISISSEPSSHSYGASYRNGSHGVNQNTSFQESLEVKNQKRLKDEQTTDKRGRSSFIIIIAMLAFLWMLSKCNG